MNFDFSEEQQMLRDSVARFVMDDYDFDTRRAIVASDEGMRRAIAAAEVGETSPIEPSDDPAAAAEEEL